MKSIIKQITERTERMKQPKLKKLGGKLKIPRTGNDRRNFLKKAALGGIALGGMMHMSIEDTIAQTTSKVQRASSPSDLKITDLAMH